ncbi:tRNA (N6-isopentenyl adenosine(37)-C2)-methylthiotransferase MiaB [Buchnera aphidicola (Mindarus keteleerifoliae)]|uniref:tRNA (N6-isopentenyl adenosine(37)-C2)-methylthiotransferase MiaB n=1 Tax=Buchnera aphidicola TaxID=9 RepID=UPI0031B699A0
MKKIHIKTWGCQMNEYDSSIISNLFLLNKKKYCLTDTPFKADVLILNTCSIREKAKEKLFHQLGRWKKIKEKNPKIIIAVGGCVATQEGKEIYNRANYVDIIFGTQTIHRLPNMINEIQKNKTFLIDISFPTEEKFDSLLEPRVSKLSSYVSIMEGCNKYCSFCIVPYTRGVEVSRKCDDVLFEIVSLAKKGIKEIHLLGQNVNAYKGETAYGGICSFSELIELIAEIKEIKRIRFTTSHPVEFTRKIINVYEKVPKLVNFLHLPVQSGSNRILKLMKRGHTISDYKKIISELLLIRPKMQISSDFIVGFPGETKKDFYKTIKLIEEINFDMSFSFIYSPRPGTPASIMKDNETSYSEKKIRLDLLQKRIRKQALNWTKKMMNSIQIILVEGVSKKNISELYGKTENNRTAYFQGLSTMIGKFVKIKITNTFINSVRGIFINYVN